MLAMLCSRNIKFADDCIKALDINFDCCAILDVPDCRSFEVYFADVYKSCSIGIVRRDVVGKLPEEFTFNAYDWFDIYDWFENNGAFAVNPADRTLSPGDAAIDVSVITSIMIRYNDGELAFSFNGNNSWWVCNSRFTSQINPDVEYQPIIFAMLSPTYNVDCILCKLKVSFKRGRNDSQLASQLKRLKTDRHFTDAVVSCGEDKFSVHKAVLSLASPVFHRAFTGSMQEARTGNFEINTHPRDAVEAMLHFIYTGELTEQIGLAGAFPSLLDLAVQYELDDLVTLSASVMVMKISTGNVKEWAYALKLHQGHAQVRTAFSKVVDQIQIDENLLMALI